MINPKYIKWVMVGSGVVAVVALITYQIINYKKTSNQQKKNRVQVNQRHDTNQSVYSQYYFDKDIILEQIIHRMPQSPSVQELFINSPFIIEDEFVKYTREMRKRRRLIRKHNEQMYINIMLSYYQEVKELLERSRQQLCDALGISDDGFDGMLQNYHLIDDDIDTLYKKTENILNEFLLEKSPKKPVSRETLQKIIYQEINFIKIKMYDRLRNKLQKELSLQSKESLLIIQCLIDDILYEKFGFERQYIEMKIVEIDIDVKQRTKWRLIMQAQIGQVDLDTSFDHDNNIQLANTIEQTSSDPIIKSNN